MNLHERVFSSIGRPLRRKEDRRLLTGAGRFTDDFTLPGQRWAVMVRSPHPHARILRIDKAAAAAHPGVLAVLDGRDAAADGLAAIDHSPLPKTRFDLKLTGPGGGPIATGAHVPLPADRVRHVGEAVAMVVADSLAQALDAAEAVEVAYEVLPFVVDARDAPGAAPLWDEAPGNVAVETRFGDTAAVDAAFARAAHVVRRHFHAQRVTGVPIEPRAALGIHDAASGRYTLWAGSGGAVRQRREIAQVLGIEEAALRVIAADVGGNFGTRNRVYVEFPLVLWAARRVGRPVRFRASRSEAFLTDYQGRDLHTTVELALDEDGNFLALRADNLSNVGSHIVSLSPLGKGSALVTGSYRIPVATLRSRAAFTNTMPTQAYRSSGRPEVSYAIERLVDLAAAELGVDRVELRRRNLVRAGDMPYGNAVGAVYDSGDYGRALDIALGLADRPGFAARKAAAAARGRRLGFGLAMYVESSIGSPRERAEITVRADGGVEVVIGTQPSGQGHETSFSQVIADLLGVPFEAVAIRLGDTDVVSLGGGSHSGRSMRHAGTVMLLASADVIALAARRAAAEAGSPDRLPDFADGAFRWPGSNRVMSLFDVAGLIEADGGRLSAARTNEMHDPVFPNGCAVAEVEVDPETGAFSITRYGAVDDVGRCINPLIVHGQTHGGIAQGVGQAVAERCVVDPRTGQPLTGSMLDYAMPRAADFPCFDTEIMEVHSPTNPLGIKAGGEGGTTPALAVMVSAVVDALSDLGVRDIQMPLAPETVWRAIRDARKGSPP